jgi:hypothetical protein
MVTPEVRCNKPIKVPCVDFGAVRIQMNIVGVQDGRIGKIIRSQSTASGMALQL